MAIPAGSAGRVTSVNGTLSVSGGTRSGGADPRNGRRPARDPGVRREAVAGRRDDDDQRVRDHGDRLRGNPGWLPARTWPTVDAEDARTGTGDWRILTPADNQFAAHLGQVSATCGGTVYLKAPDLEPDAASRTRDHDGERHRMGLPRRDPKDKPETSPRG